ncbi:tyrosinase family protein [Nannocystis punicea]|uniref:Tyrosinase family protein n=1 Tax=Nannocystis punicea TaxID=2995304 RepID=A0ABY7GU97_9BACT|nr:tyrosinase family protein [Nannocystis poenicansa]WAS90505.1 tyrosinase family protein [Nannocystis poenicansa]
MTTSRSLRVRRSIQEIQDEYTKGRKKPLEDLMRAWKGVKELPPEDPRSFFMIGGFHGEPFRGGGWGSNLYWGGYCNHGNILFPTWHRVYLLKLEEALQSIKGCEDVMLPYWDETSDDSLKSGIPWALTVETFELDGATIPNPLRSFVFPKNIVDHINGDNPNYTKLKGYETVRYPLSGLVGTPQDRDATAAHNAKFPDYEENVRILDANIVNWLTSYIVVNNEKIPTNVAQKFKDCLDAPNYTVFSNTTSAQQWNDDRLGDGSRPVVALESPHNSVHLAVGGCDVPGYDRSPIDGANGDMGENDTAGLDPIFFFHHCNVDRVFWLWQKKHGFTDKLEVIDGYPGTNSVDSQGPTPGVAPNAWLTLDSPLAPFKKLENGKERDFTSRDCINIERQLGITYSHGSLEEDAKRPGPLTAAPQSARALHVTGINRARIRGSFLVSAFAVIDGKLEHMGTEAVLSRWSVQGCANCQTHLEVKASFDLKGLHADTQFAVVVHGRDGVLFSNAPVELPSSAKLPESLVAQPPANLIKAKIEVR